MNKHELIELYINKNLPLSIIASKYNITPSALTYWIKKYKIKKSNYNIPNNITEHEYCRSIGLYRIYDCGKIRWKFNYKKEF